jgi:hypothetical protein
MKERNQVTIGVHRDKYNVLSQKKKAMEEILGRRVNWGSFFLTLVSQRSLDESAAVLHDSSNGKEANPEDYEEIFLVTKEDLEEAVEKIISEFKKYIASNTDKSQKKVMRNPRRKKPDSEGL